MQKISRVLLVGKPNDGKGLTRIVVIKKGKKSQIIKAVRGKKINEVWEQLDMRYERIEKPK